LQFSNVKARIAGVIAATALAALVAAVPASADTPTSPPPVTVLTHGDVGTGDFFVSPFSDQSKYANGLEILDPNGNVVWFKPLPQGQEASDFRAQTYRGKPVLTWWQGTPSAGSRRASTTSTTITTSRSPRCRLVTA
jgi:hypothetical protein